jgi:hypothetical protein
LFIISSPRVFTVSSFRSCRTFHVFIIIIGSLSGHDSETNEENEASREASISTSKDPSKEVKEKKKKLNKPIGKKKVHEQLQKWNERKEELHQINDTNQVSKNK